MVISQSFAYVGSFFCLKLIMDVAKGQKWGPKASKTSAGARRKGPKGPELLVEL